jgi:hypothetical protein
VESDLTTDSFPTGKGNNRLSLKTNKSTSTGKKFILQASVTDASTTYNATSEINVVDTSLPDQSKYMFVNKLPGTSMINVKSNENSLLTDDGGGTRTPILILGDEIIQGIAVSFEGKDSMYMSGTMRIKGTDASDGSLWTSSPIDSMGATINLLNTTVLGIKSPYVEFQGIDPDSTTINRIMVAWSNDATFGITGTVTVSPDITIQRSLSTLSYAATDACFQIGIVLKNKYNFPEAYVTGTCPITAPTDNTTCDDNTTCESNCMGGGNAGPIGIFSGERCGVKLRGNLKY